MIRYARLGGRRGRKCVQMELRRSFHVPSKRGNPLEDTTTGRSPCGGLSDARSVRHCVNPGTVSGPQSGRASISFRSAGNLHRNANRPRPTIDPMIGPSSPGVYLGDRAPFVWDGHLPFRETSGSEACSFEKITVRRAPAARKFNGLAVVSKLLHCSLRVKR